MRLISKIHDYYDTPFRASAGDPKYTFVRESKDIYIKGVELLNFDCTAGGIDLHFTSGLMGFCGKIYPLLIKDTMCVNYNSKGCLLNPTPRTDCYYTWDDFAASNPIIANGKAKTKTWTNIQLKTIQGWLDKGHLQSWGWEFTGVTYQPLLDIFAKERVAYFIAKSHEGMRGNKVTVYPVLKDYQFYKVFDTYTTFQKIEMFLTNDLSKPDDPYIMPVPDKIKAESHGFNKWSFRKMKED